MKSGVSTAGNRKQEHPKGTQACRIETLRVRNFRMFKDVALKNIPQFCVLVGANGTGKSTLFDVFGFLKDCLVANVNKAVQKRGGFHELCSRNANNESILIEVQFRMQLSERDRLVTYSLEIVEEKGRVVVLNEVLRYKRQAFGSPYNFLSFSRGKGYAIVNEEDFTKKDTDLERENQSLSSPDILAIKGLGQFERFKAANAFRAMIENWHVSDFHITNARGTKDITGYAEHLSETGDNLAQVAYDMYQNDPMIFNRVLEQMRRRVPGIQDILVEPTKDGKLLLQFQDGAFSDPFIDRYVSDGTMKMFAYLILLYDPRPHPLLCIEEPENQLYPKLMGELAEEFRLYAERGGQVFVSTHSPEFLNALEIQEVFWLEKKNGFSSITSAASDDQLVAFMRDGDKMGYLWEQGFFKGADPR